MRDLSLSRRLRPASAASLSLLHYLMQHAEPVPFSEQSPSYDFERLTLPGQPRHTHSSTSHSAAGIALPPLTVDLSADTGIGEIVGERHWSSWAGGFAVKRLGCVHVVARERGKRRIHRATLSFGMRDACD